MSTTDIHCDSKTDVYCEDNREHNDVYGECLACACDKLRAQVELLKEMNRVGNKHDSELAEAAFKRGVEAANEQLRIENENLHRELENYRAMDTCMCGSPMAGHTWGDGHSPVSMYDYYLGNLTEENYRLKEALAKCFHYANAMKTFDGTTWIYHHCNFRKIVEVTREFMEAR